MIFIDKSFEKTLRRYSRISDVKQVVEKLFRYRLSIQTESKWVKNKNIHIIGVAHKLNKGPGQIGTGEDNVVRSQQEMVHILDSIKPNIVGVEGYSGEKYSFAAVIREAYRINDLRCFESDISAHRDINLNDPQKRDFFQYITDHPQVLFSGTEDFELHRLQHKLLKRIIVVDDSDYEELMLGVLRLRGILMLTKLSRMMRKTEAKCAALPIGYLHLEELEEFKEFLKADWEIYNTATNIHLSP